MIGIIRVSAETITQLAISIITLITVVIGGKQVRTKVTDIHEKVENGDTPP